MFIQYLAFRGNYTLYFSAAQPYFYTEIRDNAGKYRWRAAPEDAPGSELSGGQGILSFLVLGVAFATTRE